jgi:ceramide glucosyltransferase
MIVLHIVALALSVATLIGTVYQIAAALLVRRFMRAPRPEPRQQPPVSVLKALHGDEPGLTDNLRALCRQSYPQCQIVCGTLDPADPARRVAAAVRDEFAMVEFEVVAGTGADQSAAVANRKVANLEMLLAHARHGIVAFADADVRADKHYLDDLAATLERPGAGIATCLYVGLPEPDPWSRLEALWVNHAFLPSALVARAIGRRDGCFGATIALSRATLDRAGGLAPLRMLLADDWALGAAVRRLGLSIELVARPVDMVVSHRDFASMFAHELRWARTIASLDRAGYVASILTQPVVLGLVALLAGGFGAAYLVQFIVALLVRFTAIAIQARAMSLTRAPWYLLVGREFLTFAVFVAALSGRTVRWRGSRYRILRDGSMQPLEDRPK